MSTTSGTYVFRLTGRPGDSPEVPAKDIHLRLVKAGRPETRQELLDAARSLVRIHAALAGEMLEDDLDYAAFIARLLSGLLGKLNGFVPERDEPWTFSHENTSANAYVIRSSVYYEDAAELAA